MSILVCSRPQWSGLRSHEQLWPCRPIMLVANEKRLASYEQLQPCCPIMLVANEKRPDRMSNFGQVVRSCCSPMRNGQHCTSNFGHVVRSRCSPMRNDRIPLSRNGKSEIPSFFLPISRLRYRHREETVRNCKVETSVNTASPSPASQSYDRLQDSIEFAIHANLKH